MNEHDHSDVTWDSSLSSPLGAILYSDRKLSRWEWVLVRLLRRPDPRLHVLVTPEGRDGR